MLTRAARALVSPFLLVPTHSRYRTPTTALVDDVQDTFRIRIWEEAEASNEVDVYDNRFDQEIGGGSVVINTKQLGVSGD